MKEYQVHVSQDLPSIKLKPIISYPRVAKTGETYLLTIDVQLAANCPWPYQEEEFEISFLLETAPFFTYEPLGEHDPGIVLHRFGCTYGPAEYLLTASKQEVKTGDIKIVLLNGWGLPIAEFSLPCEVKQDTPKTATRQIMSNVAGAAQAATPPIAIPDEPKVTLPPPPKVEHIREYKDDFDDKMKSRGYSREVFKTKPVYGDPNVIQQYWLDPSAEDQKTYGPQAFFNYFDNNTFRKLLSMIFSSTSIEEDELKKSCSNEKKLYEYLTFMRMQDIAVEENKIWRKSSRYHNFSNIAITLEWYVAEWFRLANAPARHGVVIKEIMGGIELDVVAFVDEKLVMVECKSGNPKNITEKQLKLFLRWVADFKPTIALLLIATENKIDKQIELLKKVYLEGSDIIGSRGSGQWDITRVVHVINTRRGIAKSLEDVLGSYSLHKDDYRPLVDLFANDHLTNQQDNEGGQTFDAKTGALPVRPRLFQVRDLPKGYIARPAAFDAIKRLLLNQQNTQVTAMTTALRGAGGFGKTTLALALCHDPEIQATFHDGIIWVELGEQPPKVLDVLNSVLTSLYPSLSGVITLKEAQDRWHTALSERRCLLVIDDVWQIAALEPLLEGGPHCARLVTTRNDQVLPPEAARVLVDATALEEAIALLCGGLPEEIQQAAYQPMLETLSKQLGYWPLLLTLAHGLLADQIHYGRTVAQALEVVERAYQQRGVTAFDPEQASGRQGYVNACLEASLRHLREFTPGHYQAAERYQELAIFPEDIDIPLTMLYIYWQGTGGLKTWETQDLCVRLRQLSLLFTCDLSQGTIRLHDVFRSYLVHSAGSKLSALHARFLESSRRGIGIERWADLSADAYYLWQNLIWHLCQASRSEELQATLTDLRFVAGKILYVGVSALETDLLQAITFLQQTNAVESARLLVESLYQTIKRISHLFGQTQTLSEIGGLLLSYLSWEPTFPNQLLSSVREILPPFLVAWYPLPSELSSALPQTLNNHTGKLLDCAVSPDGRFIVSASSDKTLKVWDAATGAVRRTLTGHTSAVGGCAVSPDGSFIVSVSSDKTLKVWDTATGAVRLTLSGHNGRVNGCTVGPDLSFVVSASSDKTLKVWDTATGEERLTLSGHTNAVFGCAASPDGRFIVSVSSDKTLKVWDAITGAERHTLAGHTSAVYGCAVSPDGSFIVSASSDKTLKVWDTATGQCMLTFPVEGYLSGCAIHPDGEHLVACGDQGMYFLSLVV